MKLRDKVCVITNCDGMQGPPIAAEFQREGATLLLQTNNLQNARPALVRSGVKVDDRNFRVIEADFAVRGVADHHFSKLVEGREDWMFL